MLYDTALAERVECITGQLVAAAAQTWPLPAGREWSVVLLDDPEMANAWCMANGRMAIYSSLLGKLNPSDDELAHVLGHGISHAVANHSAERMSLAILQGLAVTAIGIETGDSDAVEAADMLATVALSLPNSRGADYEADKLGMELAYKVGYEPAVVTLWNKMSAENGGPASFSSSAHIQIPTTAPPASPSRPINSATGLRPFHCNRIRYEFIHEGVSSLRGNRQCPC